MASSQDHAPNLSLKMTNGAIANECRIDYHNKLDVHTGATTCTTVHWILPSARYSRSSSAPNRVAVSCDAVKRKSDDDSTPAFSDHWVPHLAPIDQ